MKSENLFTGKWMIAGIYANVVKQGWTSINEYEPYEFIWEFTEEIKVSFLSGTVVYSGKLTERLKDQKDILTGYCYYPADRQLQIDRLDFAAERHMPVCINDLLRAEQTGPGEFWLYALEDVENEPHDYRFRIRIKHI